MGLFSELKNREQDFLGKGQHRMTCKSSGSSNGHTWGFAQRGGNKTPFIRSKWVKYDGRQMSLGKNGISSKWWSRFFVALLCEIVTELGLSQSEALIKALCATEPIHSGDLFQKALRIKFTGVVTAFLCVRGSERVPLEEWQSPPPSFMSGCEERIACLPWAMSPLRCFLSTHFPLAPQPCPLAARGRALTFRPERRGIMRKVLELISIHHAICRYILELNL